MCKLTVLKTELYPELQEEYLLNPQSGPCPMYHEGDEFVFRRYGSYDDFWEMGRGSQCSEAWDAISRYIYTALQGGSIMRGWSNDDRIMIACCSDGTRPVIFKIERIDYQVLYVDGADTEEDKAAIATALKAAYSDVREVQFNEDAGYFEVIVDDEVPDKSLAVTVRNTGNYTVTKAD